MRSQATIVTPLAAYVAVAWLLVLEQLDFVRYYTVTLLSENLFFLLVAATLLSVRAICERRWMVAACRRGLCGGLATGTRPTMLLYLPLAILFATAVAMKRDGWRGAAVCGDTRRVVWWLARQPVYPAQLRDVRQTGVGHGRAGADLSPVQPASRHG